MGLGFADISGKGAGKGPAGKESSGKEKATRSLSEGQEEEEEEEGEDTMREKALKKARRARDQVARGFGKGQLQIEPEGRSWSTSLSKMLVQLIAVLSGKKEVKPQTVKQLLEATAKVVKGARNETKELKQLANKEASVAGSKRSRSSK